MTVIEFLKANAKPHELCMIREAGWNCQSVWIEHENRYCVHPGLANRTVTSDSWDWLEIASDHGTEVKVKCHYIDT
jgi:hypothetical protein